MIGSICIEEKIIYATSNFNFSYREIAVKETSTDNPAFSGRSR